MSDASSQPDALWRALVEAIDDGLLVLNARGDVVYANQAAADLLDTRHATLVALGQDNLPRLFQPHRLDIARLDTVLGQDLLGPRPIEAYQVATRRQRLLVSPFAFDLPQGRFRCLLIQPDLHWRSDLIADAVVKELRNPLNFSLGYTDALINRIQSPDRRPDELVEFGRIIRSSVASALEQWEGLLALYETDPRHEVTTVGEPLWLAEAIEAAIDELQDNTRRLMPDIDVLLPHDLPPVQAQARHLRKILLSLLEETTARVAADGRVSISAGHSDGAVRVDMSLTGREGQVLVRGYVFDVLPLSVVEQTIIMQGGRLWVEGEPGQPITFSFTLPVWEGD
jgi:signal transduction histidine kinase